MDQERLLREAGAVPMGKITRLTRQLAVDVPDCEHAVVQVQGDITTCSDCGATL